MLARKNTHATHTHTTHGGGGVGGAGGVGGGALEAGERLGRAVLQPLHHALPGFLPSRLRRPGNDPEATRKKSETTLKGFERTRKEPGEESETTPERTRKPAGRAPAPPPRTADFPSRKRTGRLGHDSDTTRTRLGHDSESILHVLRPHPSRQARGAFPSRSRRQVASRARAPARAHACSRARGSFAACSCSRCARARARALS